MRPRWIRWVPIAGLVVLVTISSDRIRLRAQAQLPAVKVETRGEEGKTFTDAVTIPANRESRRLIQAAQDYIKKKEWQVAAECLQSLLETKEDSFIEVESPDERGGTVKRRVSVRTEANRLIGELPPDGLETYQLLYGQTASDRLKQALEKNDPAILAEVAFRFLHTKAGGDATNLLGTYHLDRGSYLMASLCFERLLKRKDADKLPAKVLFKAALAFRWAGESDNAEKVWRLLAEKASRADLVLGKQKVSFAQLRAEFEKNAALLTSLGQSEWWVYRGNAARNAQGTGSSAYLEPRWQYSMTPLDETNPDLPKEQIEATQKLKDLLPVALATLEGKPILPTFYPIAAGDKLLVRTYDGVHALSLRNLESAEGKIKAGEMLWRSSALGGLHTLMARTDKRMTIENWYNTFYRNQGMGPAGVPFENSVIGSLSHDGQRVYFVDDLAIPPHPNQMATANLGGQANLGPFTDEVNYSRLTAVELDSGKLRWTIGGRAAASTKESERNEGRETSSGIELQDSFFLGPPLPLGGKLYLLVEKNTELRLVCLDANKLDAQGTPEILWQQSLGTANFRLPQDSLRRLQAAHLAYGDGILVCPTNAGVVLGIDLLSHSLVWAHSYRDSSPQAVPEEMQMQVRGRFRGGLSPYGGAPLQERWRPTCPIIQNGKVVLTAFDAGALHCLNLRDGRLLWTVKREEGDLYVGGVFGSRVIIVSKSQVRAISLDDGKPLWNLASGMPSGQGTASEDIYYLPLQYAQDDPERKPGVLAIHLATGKPLGPPAKSRKKEPLGNLLFADGELISQTALQIAAFPELKRMLAEIDRRLKENPIDPIGLTERGELYLDKGDLTRAIQDLRTALAQKPDEDIREKARNKLHEAFTDLFQNDFPSAERYLDEYRALCKLEIPREVDPAIRQKLLDEQLRREANYLSLVGRGREKQGRLIDAFEAYERFGVLTGNKELVSVIDEPNTRSRPDVWSRGRIKGMLDRATPEQRSQLETAILARWQEVLKAGDLDRLRRFTAIFGTNFQVGREAQLQLAERLIAAGTPDDLTEAETKLQALCYSPDLRKQDPKSAALAIDAMIRIYLKRGLYEDAVSFYKLLGTEFARVTVRDGKTGADLLNELFTDKRFLPFLDPQGLVWKGTMRPAEAPGTFPATKASVTIEPIGADLPFFQRHRLVLDINMQGGQAWQFRLLDRATNEERWKRTGLPAAFYFFQNAQNPRFAYSEGHTLVLQLNNMIHAFDLANRRDLWSYDLFGKNPLLVRSSMNSVTLDNEGRVCVVYQDGRSEKMGGIAVVESTYAVLQTREGLIALDLNKPGPSVLWSKSDVSLRAQVFGDDQHVFIVDTAGEKGPVTVRAVRAQDGVGVPIPDFGASFQQKVLIRGGKLLLQEDDPQGQKVLRFYDARSGQNVWKRSFSPGALILRSEEPEICGVVEKDHNVTLIRTETGETLFTTPLQADHADKLQSVALIGDRERLYLALTRTPENGVSWSPNAGFGLRSLKMNGPLYALNRTTGKLEWICDFLPHQHLMLEQVRDLPILLFNSQFYRSNANGSFERQMVRVTGIDKRTGKLIYDKEFSPNNQFHALTTDPQAGLIELIRQDLKISFRPEGSGTANAAPVEPPAARRSAATPPRPGRGPVVVP